MTCLEQIVANLLWNALRYTDAGGRVLLSAYRVKVLSDARRRDNPPTV